MWNKIFTKLNELSTEKVFDLIEYQDSFKDLYPGYAPGYENEYEEEYYFPSKQLAYESVNKILSFFNGLPNPIPVYRTIKVNSIKDINYEYLGDSWSYSKESAINFAKNQNGGNVLLSGKVDFSHVDWKNTLRNYFLFSDGDLNSESEDEIKVDNFDEIKELKAAYIKDTLKEIRSLIRNIILEISNIPQIKKIKSFTTEQGNFSCYDYDSDVRDRAYMFTVWENKNGWIIRNTIVPKDLRRQGIATDFYIKMNELSKKKTKKPLRSTQARELETGEVVHELSPDAIQLWDSLVRKGLAIKISNKNYTFK